MLSCKDALYQHVDTHTEERHKCEQCPKDFNALFNLKQHLKGAHRERFISPVDRFLIGLTVEMNIKLTVMSVKRTKNQN